MVYKSHLPGVYKPGSLYYIYGSSLWKSYKKIVSGCEAGYNKSIAGRLDCLPQARVFGTGKLLKKRYIKGVCGVPSERALEGGMVSEGSELFQTCPGLIRAPPSAFPLKALCGRVTPKNFETAKLTLVVLMPMLTLNNKLISLIH